MNGTTDGDGSALFEKLKQKSTPIEIDGQLYWRVEGDLLLDEDELLLYAQQRHALQVAQAAMQAADLPLVATAELIGMTEGGKIVRWAPGTELTWTALRQTFTIGGEDGYVLAVDSVRKAAAAWEETCGVKFVYKPELDMSDELRPAGALFVV